MTSITGCFALSDGIFTHPGTDTTNSKYRNWDFMPHISVYYGSVEQIYRDPVITARN